jgi:hypothetical protein
VWCGDGGQWLSGSTDLTLAGAVVLATTSERCLFSLRSAPVAQVRCRGSNATLNRVEGLLNSYPGASLQHHRTHTHARRTHTPHTHTHTHTNARRLTWR